MKKITFGLLVLVAVLSGCDKTPEGILSTAFDALNAGDAQAFRDTLTGPAKEAFVDAQPFDQLAQNVKGRDLTLRMPSTYTAEQMQTTNSTNVQRRTYFVDILDQYSTYGHVYATATVQCLAMEVSCRSPRIDYDNVPIITNPTACWNMYGCRIATFSR